MNLIKMFPLVFLFFLSTSIYSNEEFHNTILSHANELELLVGRPFAWKNSQLKIFNSNSKGETVGEAYFQNSDIQLGNRELIAWYWHPERGFAIIGSQNVSPQKVMAQPSWDLR